ncbi:unnamed protein product [Allacma fusca]|uniref:Uncharacterized protein n=1 Tax=Allacma fusca TaxID=39272 RepID=A0A8J2LFB0_9HEXA|nr:unnamed protein product [Allacma fusca]
MRMHSYGKCSPNLAAGALTIFVLIVLYNYWNVSTLNRDLSIKLHSLEQQVITFSRANDGLSSNLEKAQDEKTNLQNSLIKEEAEEKASRDLVSQKDKLIKDLQNDLENTKQEAQNCLHESSSQDNKLQLKEKEITELKEKVVSLEAQVVEKTSQNEKIEMELSDAKDKIENLQKLASNKPTAASSKSTAASVGAKPVVSPDEQQAVLINDPAGSI